MMVIKESIEWAVSGHGSFVPDGIKVGERDLAAEDLLLARGAGIIL